jgi:competence protein ComEA
MMKHNPTLKHTILMLGLMATMAVAGATMAAKPAPSSAVDVNTASVEQLMEIPGIGLSKAQAIVEYRSGSPFHSVEELTNVKGIGEKLLAKIMPYVTANGKPAQSSGTAVKALK